jgi:hypothetical protein
MKTEQITNAELQMKLAEKIRLFDAGEYDAGHAKIYFAGARTLLSSVKIDIEGAKKLGQPLFERTREFLGAKE